MHSMLTIAADGFRPEQAPVGGSLALSAIVGLLPLLTIFVTLGWLRWAAWKAALTSLTVAVVVAIIAFKMPAQLAVLSATQGAAFGLMPIIWIVFCGILLYEITVVSGRADDLGAVFNRISDDPRIQAIVIAFCFGGMMEAIAGFGAPVAITGVMLAGIGFPAFRAACIVLLANTAPVAFGAIATPILTAGTLTGIPKDHIGALVGHQTPVFAFLVPLLLLLMADGKRGVKEVWPLGVVVGAVFSLSQWWSANHFSVELTDIVSSLAGLAAAVLMMRVWQPKGTAEAIARLHRVRENETAALAAEGHVAGTSSTHSDTFRRIQAAGDNLTGARVLMALFPYLLVIAVLSAAKLFQPLKDALAATSVKFGWPGLSGNLLGADGKASSSASYNFNWLENPGTLLLICSLIVAAVFGVLGKWGPTFGTVLGRMKFPIVTVACVLGLAYVMNQSGQTLTIGTWIAGTGAAFAWFSPVLGWLGVAVTGSDTSANALFATLQQKAAQGAGLDPTLLVAANSSGGVVGKMISPQNLTIAAASVGLLGKESDIFRKLVWWSLGLLVAMCVLVGLQAGPLHGILPQF